MKFLSQYGIAIEQNKMKHFLDGSVGEKFTCYAGDTGDVGLIPGLGRKQYEGCPRWLSGKEFVCQAEDPDSIPGLERSPGGGNGNPLQYSCLEKPWTEEPDGLQSKGSQRVRQDLATKQQNKMNCPEQSLVCANY